MTVDEFCKEITWLECAIGQPISKGEDKEKAARMLCYFELLGDLSADVMHVAVRRVASEHVWATFPSIAELRAAAAETVQGVTKGLSASEAWGLAWESVGRQYDPGHVGAWTAKDKSGVFRTFDSQLAWLLDGLPPLVVEAIKDFGFAALADADPNFARPQFLKIYEALAAREQRLLILGPTVQKRIAEIAGSKHHQIAAVSAALEEGFQ